MNGSVWFWILLNLFSIVLLGFYSMMEMACVSFNKMRLQYYVTKGMRRAVWLNDLIAHPAVLFGTTLIMVNIAMVVGSQFARDSYAAMGLSPDLAPLTQVVLVVVFGELAPMFAARRYPEHVALLGIPILYASAWLLRPFLWFIKMITFICNRFLGGKEESHSIFLSVEELQKILQKVLEEQDEERPLAADSDELNAIAANIFRLRDKSALQVMTPLRELPMLPSAATVDQMRNLIQRSSSSFICVYHRTTHNIIGIAFCRDLLRSATERRLREYIRLPWFVTENTPLMQILKQFRNNGESVAVILNPLGQASGVVTLNDVIEEIFGKAIAEGDGKKEKIMIIDRTFPAEMSVGEINKQLGIVFDSREDLSLVLLMQHLLGHAPELGDSVCLGPFELSVKEVSLLEIKSIGITSHH